MRVQSETMTANCLPKISQEGYATNNEMTPLLSTAFAVLIVPASQSLFLQRPSFTVLKQSIVQVQLNHRCREARTCLWRKPEELLRHTVWFDCAAFRASLDRLYNACNGGD